MNVKAPLHWLLASLLLVQSVVAVANVSGIDIPSQQTAATVEEAAMPGCHDPLPEAPAPAAGDCCESMDQPCCQLGCASFAQAVPMADMERWNGKHLLYSVVNGPLHPNNTPTGLFRPPRTT